MERRGCFGLFGVTSGIIAFVVDIIAFLHLFGVSFILTPNDPLSSGEAVFVIDIPVGVEVLTFLSWFYASLVIVIYSIILVRYTTTSRYNRGLGSPGLLLLVFSPLVS